MNSYRGKKRQTVAEVLEKATAAGIGVKHDSEVALAIGVSRARVQQIRVQFGITQSPAVGGWEKTTTAKGKIKKVRSLIASGKTRKQICVRLKIKPEALSKLVSAYKLVFPAEISSPVRRIWKREDVVAALNSAGSLQGAATALDSHSSTLLELIQRWDLRSALDVDWKGKEGFGTRIILDRSAVISALNKAPSVLAASKELGVSNDVLHTAIKRMNLHNDSTVKIPDGRGKR